MIPAELPKRTALTFDEIMSTTTSPDTQFRAARWQGDHAGYLELIDQTLLPTTFKIIECRTVEEVWEAIKKLRVRGAPAIGIAAAYGVCLGLQTVPADAEEDDTDFFARLKEVAEYLATSRPTAVNLFWALDRMQRKAESLRGSTSLLDLKEQLLTEAKTIESEDQAMCEAMGQAGAELMPAGGGILTHCNTGGLATAAYGTALSVIYFAHKNGKGIQVFADETRPLLQGARLTMWELQQWKIPSTLICDSMAAQVMKEGKIQAVITGADRIAANGDSANKIGTYGLAVLAKAHNIPFYIAAPSSTFDLSLASGDQIPIEERASEEITCGYGKQTAPDDVQVYNPAFDVTPAELIQAIICEHGVIDPVTTDNIAKVLGK
ncbi:Methylthioribose-1-phosphate isomerase [Planctomycetales bacterium 10988]|nr:Methylthioribose-1-phosphate isomerase [Planctomycetales bacterium 10988]